MSVLLQPEQVAVEHEGPLEIDAIRVHVEDAGRADRHCPKATAHRPAPEPRDLRSTRPIRDLAAEGCVDNLVTEPLANNRVEGWRDRNDLASTIDGIALTRDPRRLGPGEVPHSAGDVDRNA